MCFFGEETSMSMFLKNNFKTIGRERLGFEDPGKYPAKHFL